MRYEASVMGWFGVSVWLPRRYWCCELGVMVRVPSARGWGVVGAWLGRMVGMVGDPLSPFGVVVAAWGP
jgi:hypothetical protein